MILLDVAAAHAAAFDGEDRSARRRIDGNIEFADLDIVVAHEDGCLGLQCLSPSCHRVSLTAWRARSLRLRDPKSPESGPRRATDIKNPPDGIPRQFVAQPDINRPPRQK